MTTQLPTKMLACQVVEIKKPYKIHEVSLPEIKPTDLLVRVAAGSFCHTDLMFQDGVIPLPVPFNASHEGAGTVAAIGSDVKGFQVGDRVMCAVAAHGCGNCSGCNGRDDAPVGALQYCQNTPLVGITGAFAEYMTTDAKETNKLPDSITFESAAPLACAGRTVFRGIKQCQLKEGQTLAFVGSGGGLGHLGVQFGKALGLKVIGIDAKDHALKLTQDYGADHVLDARKGKDEVVKQVQEATAGVGADATVNVGDAPTAAALAAAVTKIHGRMIQIAQPSEVSVPFQELVFRDIRIEGSLIADHKDSEEMLQLVAKHGIGARKNVFHGIKEIPKLVDQFHAGKLSGKAIVVIDEEAIKKQEELGAKY